MAFHVIGFLLSLICSGFLLVAITGIDDPVGIMLWLLFFVNQGFCLVLWAKGIVFEFILARTVMVPAQHVKEV